MSRRKKIYIVATLIVLILLIGLFFAYPKIKNKFSGKHESENSSASSPASSAQNPIVDPATGEVLNSDSSNSEPPASDAANSTTNNSSQTSDENAKSIDPNRNNSTSGKMLAHITTQHCDDDCQAFANNLSFFEYCQQVCGITPVKKVSSCDGKDGIQKDYCLKDLGINKLDSSICDKISDANIKKTCKDRILQDIIEGQ
jgi:hypothetical protein